MHKFFCNYNNLTERYELSLNKNYGSGFGIKINAQVQNTLLENIKSLLEELYINIVLAKEKETAEKKLNTLDETELLISNLFYSFFASPLELPDKNRTSTGTELSRALEIIYQLEKEINIPEYNRLASIIKNNISSLI